jgi:hypothetical protein
VTVTGVANDSDRRTMTITARFEAPGNPNAAMPTTVVNVTLTEATDGHTEMEISSVFRPSRPWRS